MKSITLKINAQTFEYEIKVQAWKDTSGVDFLRAKGIEQPQLLFTNRLLFCLIVQKEERHFV